MKKIDTYNTKLITIAGSGAIPELGNITAPILNPTRVSINKVTRIVNSGRVVYEHDPDNVSKKVRLTTANCRERIFGDTAAKATTPTPAPAPSQKPAPAPEKAKETKQENKPANNQGNKAEEKKTETAKPADNGASDFTAKKD